MRHERGGSPAFVFDTLEPERPKVDRAVLYSSLFLESEECIRRTSRSEKMEWCDSIQSWQGEWQNLLSVEYLRIEASRSWFYPRITLSLALLLISALRPLPSFADQIPLEEEHGVYMVPVLINQAVSIPFIVDSGASEVAIPADVFRTLMRSHSVREG